MGAAEPDPELVREIADHRFWYHTMELRPGLRTDGWFDLDPILDRMPWPDLRGKRCLEVGPYDGHLSFEMERRGAAEVVAADIGDPSAWDWPIAKRERGPRFLAELSGERTGEGFELARRALGSRVRRIELSAYDLSPERAGRFDFVVCGSLMLHLRDPIRALEAIRGVCDGSFLSAETIDAPLSYLSRRPAARQMGGELCQWWIVNPAGHRRMLEAAGFRVLRHTRPYAIPHGPAHPVRDRRLGLSPGNLLAAPLVRGIGVPHVAALAAPEVATA